MPRASSPSNRNCFVICPIGEEKSEIRRRSDQVFKHVISPAAKECGYEALRADHISQPGMITSQVIQHLLDDPLVVADLTGRNPNVFYELAVRHAVSKPIVQIIQGGEPLPFDVAESRTIQFGHHDLDSVAKCRDELVVQIHKVESNPSDVDTPISVALDLKALRQSDNPLEKSSAEIITMLQEMRARLAEITERQELRRVDPMGLEELYLLAERLRSVLDVPSGKKLEEGQLEVAQQQLRRLSRTVEMVLMHSGMSPEMTERMLHRARRPAS